MVFRILFLLFICFTIIFINKIFYTRRIRCKNSAFLEVFKKNITSKQRRNQRIFEHHLDFLSSDPINNIKINQSDKEIEILEKLKIHKARLIKFGKSKMNGQTFYRCQEGNIFVISENGQREFI